jgi:hypothetical protein
LSSARQNEVYPVMKRSIPAIGVLAGTLLVPLLGGCALLGGERYVVGCTDIATDVCRRAYERAAADFHRTRDERIESIEVGPDGSVTICTASGCVPGTPAD